jgi:tellurite resistance protein TerC
MTHLWILFLALVTALLLLDLFVFHRNAHVVSIREALILSAFWIALSMVFMVFVYFAYEHHWFGLQIPDDDHDGADAVVLFFTGYLIEKSLSIDNIFVIAMVFSFFGIPPIYQHRILFWGIFGALLTRGVMIGIGSLLIERFHWLLYLFGAILILTAVRMFWHKAEPDPAKNPIVRLARKLFPVTEEIDGDHFTLVRDGKRMLTPLALALIVVEATDIMFAIDSIPAIFAITADPFLVFTCNVFAMLGLRSLYFALAGILDKFYYLKISLAALLGLIGVKMIMKDVLHVIPYVTYYTLGAIALILGTGVVASLIRARRLNPS